MRAVTATLRPFRRGSGQWRGMADRGLGEHRLVLPRGQPRARRAVRKAFPPEERLASHIVPAGPRRVSPLGGTHAKSRRDRRTRTEAISHRRPVGRYASILNRLSGPSSGNSRSSASRSIATQPTVGEKVLRAMWRKIALPAPATVGKRL